MERRLSAERRCDRTVSSVLLDPWLPVWWVHSASMSFSCIPIRRRTVRFVCVLFTIWPFNSCIDTSETLGFKPAENPNVTVYRRHSLREAPARILRNSGASLTPARTESAPQGWWALREKLLFFGFEACTPMIFKGFRNHAEVGGAKRENDRALRFMAWEQATSC